MQEYSIKETCKITGLTYNTLKFYCNEGLIPNVKRSKNNYRVFDDNNIGWIKNLLCLKNVVCAVKKLKIIWIYVWKEKRYYDDILNEKIEYNSFLINN